VTPGRKVEGEIEIGLVEGTSEGMATMPHPAPEVVLLVASRKIRRKPTPSYIPSPIDTGLNCHPTSQSNYPIPRILPMSWNAIDQALAQLVSVEQQARQKVLSCWKNPMKLMVMKAETREGAKGVLEPAGNQVPATF